ncbi:MAG: hypothetical protein Q8J64_01530 [Thermodesulfovibrionales bacterium]|nr:hypothetical protein [Thermodesulfovibrionales bacterium]
MHTNPAFSLHLFLHGHSGNFRLSFKNLTAANKKENAAKIHNIILVELSLTTLDERRQIKEYAKKLKDLASLDGSFVGSIIAFSLNIKG